MIDHIKLFMIMADILIGAVVAAYVILAYRRYRLQALKFLFLYVVFYNLLAFVLLAAKYYDVNIGSEVFRIPEPLGHTLTYFLMYSFIIGFFVSAAGIYASLLGKKPPAGAMKWVWAATAALLAGILAEPLLPAGSVLKKVHYEFYENFGALFVVLELWLVVSLLWKAGRLEDGEARRAARSFSWLYLSRYPVIALMILLPQPYRLFLGILYPNLVPLIWYRGFLLPPLERAAERAAVSTDLPSVAERYGLSPRETEILGLILEGKSNRDMEESLFISYHTVKNHVYSIYRKMGVKSRFELLHMLSGIGE